MIKMMQYKKIWFLISALLLVPGIVSLLVWHLNLGVDFTGGSLSEYQTGVGKSGAVATQDQMKASITKIYQDEKLGTPTFQIDTSDKNEVRYFVQAPAMDSTKHTDIMQKLQKATPSIEELSFEAIDPQIGADVTRKAIEAIVLASLAIILYIAFSFRGVPKPASSWQFGIFAVVALLHDVLFILGFASLMGHFFGWSINSEFVTAALTVMGFSVHDTIVVFDRLRENLKRIPSADFQQIANISVSQTIARSLNTSLTVVLVLLCVVLLGGSNIQSLALTLLVGIAVGTYSSIFVATPLLDWWQDISKQRRNLLRVLSRSTNHEKKAKPS